MRKRRRTRLLRRLVLGLALAALAAPAAQARVYEGGAAQSGGGSAVVRGEDKVLALPGGTLVIRGDNKVFQPFELVGLAHNGSARALLPSRTTRCCTFSRCPRA